MHFILFIELIHSFIFLLNHLFHSYIWSNHSFYFIFFCFWLFNLVHPFKFLYDFFILLFLLFNHSFLSFNIIFWFFFYYFFLLLKEFYFFKKLLLFLIILNARIAYHSKEFLFLIFAYIIILYFWIINTITIEINLLLLFELFIH